ncbi:MAG TPA: SMC-Scp complex subunit ScpB [Candidatus Competibacter sp.]|jgi:segregation and condensation protein B|nr:SMC-Scp complex subunit ScpB [Candidatus Competibacter sp.]HRX62139.1 SMC-Scp complex subunit ScpB [Candidatus Competibacter sp.]HUM90638.1 SMC-Scp complex subunit ScpB [Candidatus Competibacter sp.]
MPELTAILEAVLLAATEPLSLDRLLNVFPEIERPDRTALRAALAELATACEGRGVELVEVASGFRLQVPADFAPWVSRLWEERAANYSRALLETLALIAYRQPITRGEIEAVRGVSLSSGIMRTLQERGWIKVVGHREVPGRPALYATTHAFLDYFNLKSLSELPPLATPRDLNVIGAELDRRAPDRPDDASPAMEPADD